MNNDTFMIEESDLELAKNICKTIKSTQKRNRAVANVLAADIASKYFSEIEVDATSGIHTIPQILGDIEIADIYLKDSYIDVRLYFEENQLCVPKEHFDRNILPVAYMFIKIDSELSNGCVTGFIQPSSVRTENPVNGYYQVTEEDLVSYYDIECLLVSNYTDETPGDFELKLFDYLDGRLDDVDEFYKVLLNSKYCRNQLRDAANVKNIFNFVSLSADLKPVSTQADSGLDLDLQPSGELKLLEEVESLEESPISLSLDLDSDESVDMLNEDLNLEPSVDFLEESQTETVNLDSDFEEFNNSELEPVIEQEPFELEADEGLDLFTDKEEFPLAESSSLLGLEEVVEEVNFTEQTSQEEIVEDSLIYNSVAGFLEVPSTDENGIVDSSEIVEPVKEVVEEELANETPNDSVENLVDDFEDDLERFATNTTPSLDAIDTEVEENNAEDLESLLETDKSIFDEDSSALEKSENSSQIEDLYGGDADSQEILQENFVQPVKKSGSKLLPFVGVLTILAALGYFGYTKFYASESSLVEDVPESIPAVVNSETKAKAPIEAMPIETVENVNKNVASNEGNAISIPAIEQNLDASILVSNLSINWEVPAGYLSNNTAKRYFTKIGKIIQLNLKTELLLLNKPPITNKIMLELEFNKKDNKFNVKGVTASSGEKVVDDLIVKTVEYALDMNLKSNMNVFAGISGYPVLIIRL